MKRVSKTAIAVLALCLCASVAHAQSTLVTGQVLDPTGIPYAGAAMKIVLVDTASGVPVGSPTVTISSQAQCTAARAGTAPCQIPIQGTFQVTLDSGGNIPGGGIVLSDNTLVTPSGTQWLFTVSTLGVALPLGTGPQTFSVTLTISGASQSITTSLNAAALVLGRGAAPSAVAGPIINVKFPTALCPLCTAFGDTQQVQDAHMASGSNNVTSATRSCVNPADLFKLAFVVANNTTIELSPAVTTITGCNGNAWVLNQTNANADCGGTNCFFTYGHDDTVPVQAAVTAGISNAFFVLNFFGQVPQVFFPAGGYMTSAVINAQPASSSSFGASMICDPGGASTTFFTRPDITVSPQAIAILFGGLHNTMQNCIFNGSNVMYNASAPVDYASIRCGTCDIDLVNVQWIGYNSGGTPGGALSMDTSSFGGNISVFNSGVNQGSNSIFNNMKGCRILVGKSTSWKGGVCSNMQAAANLSVENVNPTDSDGSAGGAVIDSVLTDECANVAGRACAEQINSKNVRWVNNRHWGATGGANYAFLMDGTSQGTFSGENFGPFCVSCTAGKGMIILAGGRADVGLSTFRCFGTDNCINNSGTFNDMPCGNHFAGNSSANYAGAGVIYNCPSLPIIPQCLLASAAGPLACGASSQGKVAVPVTTSTYTINTTAGGTAILIPTSDNTGIPGAPACGAEVFGDGAVTASTPGTSFTFAQTSAAVIKCYRWIMQ